MVRVLLNLTYGTCLVKSDIWYVSKLVCVLMFIKSNLSLNTVILYNVDIKLWYYWPICFSPSIKLPERKTPPRGMAFVIVCAYRDIFKISAIK